MTTYTQQLNLDVSTTGRYKYVYAKQGDRASRFVNVTMFRDGEKIMPESGLSAKIRAVKPDGTSIYNPATINEDGSITAELTAQTLAVNGDVLADIVLVGSNEAVLSSVSFVIRVEEAPLGTVEPSSSEFLELMELLLATEEASREAGTSATAAANSKSDSEAYAIGKRNGQAVPSSDPAYHNNAKYYAEQAETDMKPVKYVAQTLTDAQKAQARQNINAAAPDGYYGESGGVMQYSTNFLGKNTPQNARDIVFRPTASKFSGQSWSADSIGGQTATIEKLRGKTVVFNQLIDQARFPAVESSFTNGVRVKAVDTSKGTITIEVAEGGATAQRIVDIFFNDDYRIPEYHKRILTGTPKNGSSSSYGMNGYSNGAGRGLWDYGDGVISSYHYVTRSIGIVIFNGCPAGTYVFKPNLTDLTQMFGAGNEPSTVAEFRAMFPLDYYEYNAGGLLSFNGTGLKTVGFNQWDEEWELGTIDNDTGATVTVNDRIRGKNFIKVVPETAYYVQPSAGGQIAVMCYNGNYEYLGIYIWNDNGLVTTPKECHYIKLKMAVAYGTSYKHDVNVNIAWSGVRNGDYEAYWDGMLSLPTSTYFPDGMKSVGMVFDELRKDKAVQRIGSRAYESGDESDSAVMTDGTTTYYVLAEPVETIISPELNLTYRVDDFGTEMLLPQNDDEPTTAPMDADIVYQIDYEAKVRNNDSLNISKVSMDNFIAAFNASGIGSIVQTWDAANKRYTYTVTAPQPEEE